LPVEVKCLQKAPIAMFAQSLSTTQAEPTRAVATGVHFWKTQFSPGPHVEHAVPNEPQADERLPLWQKPNWQQPIGQVVGPQPWQLPLRHCEPAGQTVHAWPFAPQANGSCPRVQVPFEQQPMQVIGPQPPARHMPPLQTLPGPHDWHAWPPRPQLVAFCALGGMQRLPAQQPEQVLGLHALIAHVPSVQARLFGQTAQAAPPRPHWLGDCDEVPMH
jgi:hypothetical protein